MLPIKDGPNGKFDLQQIIDIAGSGNGANIFMDAIEAAKGFEALNEEFAIKITKDVCKDPCKHAIDESATKALINH